MLPKMNAPPKAISQSEIRFAILAVDVAVIAVLNDEPHILLVSVHLPPDIVRARALPGGLVHPHETAEEAAARHLTDTCGLGGSYSEQLWTFSGIDRDPRGRVVSVAYLVLVPEHVARNHPLPEGLRWWPAAKVGRLAYDHNEIVDAALERLRTKLQSTTIARHLLAPRFTLSELQNTYESVLGRSLDKRNFRKKLIGSGIVRATGKKLQSALGRPSELYRFAGSKVEVISILSGTGSGDIF
jgi:8-oxo-dGTP diphosphatase